MLKEVEEARVKERQIRKPESVKESFPEQNNGQSRDMAAAKTNSGKSGKTLEVSKSFRPEWFPPTLEKNRPHISIS